MAYRHNNCDSWDDFEDCREKVVTRRARKRDYKWCIEQAWKDMMDDCENNGRAGCNWDVENRFSEVEKDFDCLRDDDSCGCPWATTAAHCNDMMPWAWNPLRRSRVAHLDLWGSNWSRLFPIGYRTTLISAKLILCLLWKIPFFTTVIQIQISTYFSLTDISHI